MTNRPSRARGRGAAPSTTPACDRTPRPCPASSSHGSTSPSSSSRVLASRERVHCGNEHFGAVYVAPEHVVARTRRRKQYGVPTPTCAIGEIDRLVERAGALQLGAGSRKRSFDLRRVAPEQND